MAIMESSFALLIFSTALSIPLSVLNSSHLEDFNIVPHYMREDHKKWTKDFFERVLKDNLFPVYAIKDTQMIVYKDGELEFVGGKPEVFGKKKI